MPTPSREARGEITQAWWAWNAFWIGAVVTLAFAVVDTAGAPYDAAGAGAWLLLPAALVAFLLVPAVLVLKSDVLLAPLRRKGTDPAGYRKGLLLVWAALEIGVVLACIAVMVSGTLLPGGVFAVLLTMGIFALRPSAEAVGA